MVLQVRGNLTILAGLEAQARGDREATIQALEEALRLFGAAGNVPTQDQPPFVHQLLAEVRREQQAGSIPPPHSDPSDSRMPAEAAEPVPASVPAPRAKRRWWPWGR